MASDELDHFPIDQTLDYSVIGTSGFEEHFMTTFQSSRFGGSLGIPVTARSQNHEGWVRDEAA